MRFSSLLVLLATGLTSILANPVARQNSCFDDDEVTCRGCFADSNNATIAITNACAKMSCTPGENPSVNPVTGIVKGFPYTATLKVGKKCAGLTPWNTDACVALFKTYLYPKCKDGETKPHPPADFPLASKSSTCDDSWLSFNFGG